MKCFLWVFSFGVVGLIMICAFAVVVSPMLLDSRLGQQVVTSWPSDVFMFVMMVLGFVVYCRRNPGES